MSSEEPAAPRKKRRCVRSPEAKKRRRRVHGKTWRKKYPEKARAIRDRWRAKNRERCRLHAISYREKHRIEIATRAAARRAAIHQSVGSHSAADVRVLYLAQGGRCYYCNKELPLQRFHVDHMTPLSRGGSNGPENLACSCPPCNLRKLAMTAEEFLAARKATTTHTA